MVEAAFVQLAPASVTPTARKNVFDFLHSAGFMVPRKLRRAFNFTATESRMRKLLAGVGAPEELADALKRVVLQQAALCHAPSPVRSSA